MARVYAVASAKGGVGKTTTAANLAATLAAADYDVAVVDGDIAMANLAGVLGVDVDGATLHDVLAGDADVADATYEGPHGLSVVPGSTDLAAFSDAAPKRLGRVVGSFADRDFVIVDTGAGLSHETALPLGLADTVVLVSTADRDALTDTEKTRQLAGQLDGDVAGVVLTRVTDGTPDDIDPLEPTILGVVPEDEAQAAANAAGQPITVSDPDSPAAAGYRSVASELADGPVRPPVSDTVGGEEAESDDVAGGEAADDEGEPVTDDEETVADDEAVEGDEEPAEAVEDPADADQEPAEPVEEPADTDKPADHGTAAADEAEAADDADEDEEESEGKGFLRRLFS